jgi:uncharacterized protein with HEPN domain
MRKDRLLLEDIRDAISVIRQYTPTQRSALDNDPPLQSHLLRHIQIMGEASRRVSDSLKQLHPEVPWQRIAAMRHVLVHDYFRVDLDQVWNVVTVHIPEFQPQIETILGSLPPEDQP